MKIRMILSVTNISIDKNNQLARTGIIMAMASIIMLFGTLISSFFVLKIRLVESLHLPENTLIIGIINTALLCFTSISYIFSEKMYKQEKFNTHETWLFFTVLGGYGFILGQWLLWSELMTLGIPITFGQLSDMFYVISGVHLLHILIGQSLLLWVQLSRNNNYKRIQNVGMVWHFLTILWVAMFISILL
tara:strand:- start:1421 stop:1990 length:570 start_codon:yes stop_codon:yes gene_type:complete